MSQVSIARFFKPKKVECLGNCSKVGEDDGSRNSPTSVVEDTFISETNDNETTTTNKW